MTSNSQVIDAIEGRLARWRREFDAHATRAEQRMRILRIALEAIYGTPDLTLAEARELAWRALEDTE